MLNPTQAVLKYISIVYRVTVRIDVALDTVRAAFLVQRRIHKGQLRDVVQKIVDLLLFEEELLVGGFYGSVVGRY